MAVYVYKYSNIIYIHIYMYICHVENVEIVKKADLSRFQSEVSQAGPSKSILIYDTKLFVDY